MPAPFNIVAQHETQTLDEEADGAMSGVVIEKGSRFSPRYVYLSPLVKKMICGSVILLILGIVTVASVANTGSGSGQWPPPEVNEEDYAQSVLNLDRKPVSFSLELKPETSFRQISKVTTTATMNLAGEGKYAEMMQMQYENEFSISPWQYFDGDNENGLSIEVIFNKIAVTTKDSVGDATYYSSLNEGGDTDFDAVLQDMISIKATVDVNGEYEIVNEEDNENQLEELEQEYSIGTTTGLSAISQVSQITSLKSFLPNSSTVVYKPGDSWDVEYDTDVSFVGTGRLLGYVEYNGIECAVIQNDFKLNQGADNTLDVDDLDNIVEIEEGSIKTIVFWDVLAKIPRYVKYTIEMTTEIDMDDQADDMIVPMTETVELYFSPL